MASVQIRSKKGGGHEVIVDGVDMSQAVLARDFSVTFPPTCAEPATVHMTVVADTLDIDLPETVVDALRAPAEASADDSTEDPA